jgi:hypothetical protein
MYAELKRKVCKQCKEEKDVSEFRFREVKNTYESYCKACEKSNYQKWYRDNKEHNSKRDWVRNINTKFGLTEGEYVEMYEAQNKGCAICAAPRSLSGRRLAVDHDHTTKLLRALLCNECNTAIGLLKEDLSILKAAIAYLEKFKK